MQQALRQFSNLPLVEFDPARQQSVEDLVFQARVQLDMIDEGEAEATASERRQLERFVRKWR